MLMCYPRLWQKSYTVQTRTYLLWITSTSIHYFRNYFFFPSEYPKYFRNACKKTFRVLTPSPDLARVTSFEPRAFDVHIYFRFRLYPNKRARFLRNNSKNDSFRAAITAVGHVIVAFFSAAVRENKNDTFRFPNVRKLAWSSLSGKK